MEYSGICRLIIMEISFRRSLANSSLISTGLGIHNFDLSVLQSVNDAFTAICR